MSSAEYDLGYLRAGVGELENYLLSKELYWVLGVRPPAGEPDYPRLTLGGLLLAQGRAHAWSLTAAQNAEVTRLDAQIDRLHAHWQVAWGHKAAHSFHARLLLWQNFLEDYQNDPGANADRYPYEVRRRVMLQLLAPAAEAIPPFESDLLYGLDGRLNAALLPGEFIWRAEIRSGFPEQVYWYLYGRLRGD